MAVQLCNDTHLFIVQRHIQPVQFIGTNANANTAVTDMGGLRRNDGFFNVENKTSLSATCPEGKAFEVPLPCESQEFVCVFPRLKRTLGSV
jgi:hypothetical protein